MRARKPEALKIALLNPQGFNSCRPTLYHLSRARQAKPGKKMVTAHRRVGRRREEADGKEDDRRPGGVKRGEIKQNTWKDEKGGGASCEISSE